MGRGEALHVRRAGATPSLPCPALPRKAGCRLHCSRWLSEPAAARRPQVWTSGHPLSTGPHGGRELGFPGRQLSWSPQRGWTAAGAGWAEATPGSWAVDRGLTGIWGHWGQSFSGVHAEACWVRHRDTAGHAGLGAGRGHHPFLQVLSLSGQVSRRRRGLGRPLSGERLWPDAGGWRPCRCAPPAQGPARGQDSAKGGPSPPGRGWALGHRGVGCGAILGRVSQSGGHGCGRGVSCPTRRGAGVHAVGSPALAWTQDLLENTFPERPQCAGCRVPHSLRAGVRRTRGARVCLREGFGLAGGHAGVVGALGRAGLARTVALPHRPRQRRQQSRNRLGGGVGWPSWQGYSGSGPKSVLKILKRKWHGRPVNTSSWRSLPWPPQTCLHSPGRWLSREVWSRVMRPLGRTADFL